MSHFGNSNNSQTLFSLAGKGVEEVPKGFVSWYKMQEALTSHIFFQIDTLLSDNEVFSATEIYLRETSYNRKKVWH